MSKIVAFLPAAVYYGLITLLSSRSNARLPVYFFGIDKCIHFLLYGGFGVCLAWGRVRSDSRGEHAGLGGILMLGALSSALDEIHQMFVPGRNAEWADLAADILGVLAGWALLRAAFRRRDARRRRRASPGAAPHP